MRPSFRILLSIITLGLSVLISSAFPPAPSTTIYGTVRGPYGWAIESGNYELVILANGTEIAKTPIKSSPSKSENYRLTLPVDLNPTTGEYRPGTVSNDPSITYTAHVAFNDQVIPVVEASTGAVTIQPSAGKVIELNFKIGSDEDGDGLPDSWEIAQLEFAGIYDGDLSRITPEGDLDNDGLNNYAEYIAGTFAYLFEDAINLSIIKVHNDSWAELRFLTVIDKTYQLERSSDAKTWQAVSFTFNSERTETATSHKATNSVYRTIYTPPAEDNSPMLYRIRVF